MISATAVAHTGPTPRAQHDFGVSRREIRTPPLPQTELSGTTPGNTGRAAGSQRNGTLLLTRRWKEGGIGLEETVKHKVLRLFRIFWTSVLISGGGWGSYTSNLRCVSTHL